MNRADTYLAIAHEFQLGRLLTEARHPETRELSTWAKCDLLRAISTWIGIDKAALGCVSSKSAEIGELAVDVDHVMKQGGRIFIAGCGATGRLALSLESLWREYVGEDADRSDRIVSFMAGGDYAFVRSIENFEDHPEFGARQLHDLNFQKSDLLIAVTEGGETPFVIGVVEEAARLSNHRPYFLYCNPDDILIQTVERSARILTSKAIKKINLTVGPMALSGSTRLQASTVLMAAVGAALPIPEFRSFLTVDLVQLNEILDHLPVNNIKSFIETEAHVYAEGGIVTYSTEHDALTILTDLTERTPTFNLPGFENALDSNIQPAPASLTIPHIQTSEAAWREVLHRTPRCLTWPGYEERFGLTRTLGFDFSAQALLRRQKLNAKNTELTIRRTDSCFEFQILNARFELPLKNLSRLGQTLLLKMILNLHSTLVMGRLNRYEQNVMVWVRPSNNKLIDRAARYILFLLAEQSIAVSYEDVIRALLDSESAVDPDRSVVLEVAQKLGGKFKNSHTP